MEKALKGLKVLDLTRVLAGPFCTMNLGDLGAEIIKIEVPDVGDDSRSFPPFINGESAYFMSLNRNKSSMTLNLKSQEGKEIFIELVKKVDVVIENFRPGTMGKLGLGYDELRKHNPAIIYAACSGYGHTGPYSNYAAYDLIVQGMGGIMSITGTDENSPTKVGPSVGDMVAGLYSCIGILTALYHRNLTGEGQMVDVAMLDCQVALLENAIARYVVTGKNPVPIGNRHPSIAPFEAFDSKDGYIVIAAGNDSLWAKLCNIIEKPQLINDSRFATNPLRVTNHSALKDELSVLLKTKSTKEWIELLNQGGVPCGPINKIGEVLEDPQVLAREMILEVEDKKVGKLKIPGIPVKLSKTPGKIEKTAPLLGENTEEILKSYLGYDDDKIAELRNLGAL